MRYLILLFFFVGTIAQGQDSIPPPLNKFDFTDGFYTSFEDFKYNNPSHSLKALKPFMYRHDADANGLFLDPKTIEALPSTPFETADALWGICIEGTPYIKVETDSASYFTRLYVVGNLSYYYYRTFIPKTVYLDVYNPFTGKKMGTKPIINQERIQVEKMFKLEDGQVIDFSYENLSAAIEDDKELLATLQEIPEKDRESKLFRILLIYNDRNPVQFR